MCLPWVRLDTQFATNPKILYLIEDKQWQSIVVWVASLAYSGAHGTDGFVSKASIRTFFATKRDVKNLVEVGLWDETLGGWQIHDWAEYQPSTQEMAARKKRHQAAAMRRWHPELRDQ